MRSRWYSCISSPNASIGSYMRYQIVSRTVGSAGVNRLDRFPPGAVWLFQLWLACPLPKGVCKGAVFLFPQASPFVWAGPRGFSLQPKSEWELCANSTTELKSCNSLALPPQKNLLVHTTNIFLAVKWHVAVELVWGGVRITRRRQQARVYQCTETQSNDPFPLLKRTTVVLLFSFVSKTKDYYS